MGNSFYFFSKLESHKRIHFGTQETASDICENQASHVHESNQQEFASSANKKQTSNLHCHLSQEDAQAQIMSSIDLNQSFHSDQSISQANSQKQTFGNVTKKQILCFDKPIENKSDQKQSVISADQPMSSQQSASHNRTTHMCSVCRETFTNFSDLETHLHTHRHEENITCHICGKQIRRCYHFIRHVRMHVGKESFSCTVCGKKSYRSDLIADHMRTHSVEKRSAEVTRISSENETPLRASKVQKLSPEDHVSFTCDASEKGSSHLTMFEAPKSTHSDRNKITASAGNKRTLYSDQLALQIESQEQVTDNVSTIQLLGSRRTKSLASNTGPFSCSICGIMLGKYLELEAHLRVHKQEETFLCNVCNTRIAHCNNFIRHLRLHYSIPLFSCGVCGLRSYNPCDLKKHMMIHTGGHPFSCSVCNKKFMRLSRLNAHKKSQGHDVA